MVCSGCGSPHHRIDHCPKYKYGVGRAAKDTVTGWVKGAGAATTGPQGAAAYAAYEYGKMAYHAGAALDAKTKTERNFHAKKAGVAFFFGDTD